MPFLPAPAKRGSLLRMGLREVLNAIRCMTTTDIQDTAGAERVVAVMRKRAVVETPVRRQRLRQTGASSTVRL